VEGPFPYFERMTMIRLNGNLTIGDVLVYYERDYLKVKGRELLVNRHRLDKLDAAFGRMAVLMPVDIDKFLKHYKAASRNRYRSLLGGALRWGKEMGYVSGDIPPLTFKVEREKGARTRRMTPDEETRLREAMGSDLADLFTAAIDTGLRRGALLRLQVRDVGEGILNVPANIQKDGESQRIPLTKRLGEIVGRRIRGRSPTDSLLPVSDFRHQWERARVAASITNLHWHDLRGEFASRLSEAGVGIETVSSLLGHASIEMTQRYLRPRLSQFDDAIRKLGV
jgi:integrase